MVSMYLFIFERSAEHALFWKKIIPMEPYVKPYVKSCTQAVSKTVKLKGCATVRMPINSMLFGDM